MHPSPEKVTANKKEAFRNRLRLWLLVMVMLTIGAPRNAARAHAPEPSAAPHHAPAPRGTSATPPAAKQAPAAIPLHMLAGAIEPIHSDDPTLPADLVAAARGKVLEGTYKLCIATSGNVKSVVPVIGIAGADKAIIAVLSTWKFPTLPVAICKLQKLSFEIP